MSIASDKLKGAVTMNPGKIRAIKARLDMKTDQEGFLRRRFIVGRPWHAGSLVCRRHSY